MMRESDIELNLCETVHLRKGRAYKFVSPGQRGVPDRLVLMPVPEEHRALVARYVRFVEVKAPGEYPSPQQANEHRKLRRLGFTVQVTDNIGANAQLVDAMINEA